MPTRTSKFTTRELSTTTLPDFDRLLASHPAPGAYNCWCMHNHRPCPLPERARLHGEARAARNRRQKHALVAQDKSHGILVYANGEVVGWCQYGPQAELPRIENDRRYAKIASADDSISLWRISCFIVDKKYRRLGVAILALTAALDAIKKRGGGLVEAYPIIHWGAETEYRGSKAMFERAGFKVVAPFGKNNVVMRKRV